MSSQDGQLSDEALAELLKKDAKDSSIKYSAMGLQAFLPKRPTASAPKPNTRFLRNIIQETNTHNAALKAKEIGEAAERMRGLRTQDAASNGSHKRKRDEPASRLERPRKRREEGRLTPPMEPEARGRSRRDGARDYDRSESDSESRRGRKDRRSRKRRDRSDSRSPRRSSKPDASDGGPERRRHVHERSEERHGRKRRHRSPSRSPSRAHRRERREASPRKPAAKKSSAGLDINDALVRAQRKRHRGTHSPTGARSRSSSPSPREHRAAKRHHLTTSERGGVCRGRSPARDQPATEARSSDSDPLDDILGPAPPPAAPPAPRPRGRGAVAAASGIDARFADSYDPNADLQPGDLAEEDDWGMVLEAHKDRARMRQQHAERLRQAGFSEQEVEKWQRRGPSLADGSGGGDGREEDVVWKKKGEGREWDRGKVVEAGEVAEKSKGSKARGKGK